MIFSKKIKTVVNKIEQNKTQYNLDRKTAKILALLSGNVGKYEFLTDENNLPEKGLLKKAATIIRSEYLSLGNKLKKQIDIAGKQYRWLNKVYELDKKESDETINKDDDKTPTIKKYNKSNLIYNSNHSFTNIKILTNLIFLLNRRILVEISNDFKNFIG